MQPPAVLALSLLAQVQASLGAGVGTVRFRGGSSFSAATVSPALQHTTSDLYLGAGTTLSSLAGGDWATNLRADGWAAAPARTGPRVAVSVNVAASTRTDAPSTLAAFAAGEVLWPRSRWGVAAGAGPSLGAIEGEAPITVLRLRGRAWWETGGVQYTLTVEPQRFLDAWFTDATAGATLDRDWVVLSLWATARLSAVYGSKGAASGFLQVFLTPGLSLEAGGGGYLNDPYQGFPRAGYWTAGLRLHAPSRPGTPRASKEAAPGLLPLTPARRGDTLVVRFRMQGAASVAIAGDWNSWQPVPLSAVGDDVWEASLRLRQGTYHFSLLVDGREWVVPGGVALVPDGMGGKVAVLLVP